MSESVNSQHINQTIRDRIAEVLYGDGDELAWPRALELADLIMWELGKADNG